MILNFRWWKFLVLSPILIVVAVSAVVVVALTVDELFLEPLVRWGQK